MPSNPLHHPKGRRVRLGKRSQHARLQSDDADFADGEVSQRELSEDGTLPSPELAAPLFSRLTFNWMKPLLALGNRRALEFDDLPDLASVDAAAPIQASFDAALPPYRRGSGGSAVSSRAMTIAFFRAFGRPFLFAALLKLVHDSFLFVGPQLLRHIIRFLQTPDAPLSEGLGYAALLLLSGMVQSVALRQYFFRCFRTGMRIRSAVVTMVYRKSLTVSPAARQALSTGKVTNLMSVDAQRMQDLTPYLQSIWFSFFQIIMCMYFLWEEVGASCLGGVTVLALMIPLSARISFKMRQLQQRMMKVKDKRIMLTNETLQGIKTVKMQAWESATRAKITATREEELRLFRRYLLARALLFMIQNTAPLLVAIATFATYTAKQPLDVSTAFVCLALFDILRSPLWQLPSVLNNIIEAQVSLDRLSAFMSAPDIKAVGQGGLLRGVEGGVRVRIRGGAFSWGNTAGDDSGGGGGGGGDGGKGVTADAARVPLSAAAAANAPTGGPQHALTGVDLEVREGELLAVVGHVGSGKSSLLAAVLGEIRVVAGDVAVAVSSIAYVAQTPFIMNATLRENVLFGRAFDDARYRRVLAACALLPDLAQLPAGDATEIGEKGINLSGGQKARVSLARAVYADAELYLIDDPLSAVDAHVASHIFTSLFGGDGGAEEGGGGSEEGMLAGKTVVLVTNAMQFLPSRRVTRVAVLRPPGGAMAASANVRAAADAANSAASARGALALDDDDDAVEISLDDGPPGGAGRGSASPLASAAGASSPSSLADVGTFAELQLRGGGAFRQLMDACGESTGSTGALADAIGASNAAVTVAATGLVQRRGSALLTGDEAEGAAASSSSSSSSSSRGGGGSSGAGGDPRSHLDRRMDELSDSLCAAAAAKKYDAAADLAALLQAMVAEREDAAANADADPLAPKGGDDSADGAGAGSGAGGLMSVEERSYGDVAGRVYMQYARAMGGWVAPLSVVGGYLLGQLAVVSSRWWLSYWSEHGEGSSVEGGGEGGSQGFYLGVYAAFAIGQCACLFVQYATCMFFGLRAARSTFEAMLSRILRAPMSFFDTTPMGRIMNRFSKEVNTVDAQLPTTWNSYLSTLATVIGVIFAILAATPLFALALVPILSLYVLSQRFFIRTSRELKRLDSISRSPLYAHFSETLDGTATVRAYARQPEFRRGNEARLDRNQAAYFLTFTANCWLAIRLELAGSGIVFFAALCAVLQHGSTDPSFPGMAGLSISFALGVTQSLNWSVRMASDREAQMVSVERMRHFSTIPIENVLPGAAAAAARRVSEFGLVGGKEYESGAAGDKRRREEEGWDEAAPSGSAAALAGQVVPQPAGQQRECRSWLTEGRVELRRCLMRYRPGLEPVLRDISFSIEGGEKVGVCGRTGAGKSSVILALLRIVELDKGSVKIDGRNIATLHLDTLRQAISIIPQDPVLFSGSVRENLDPFSEFDDAALARSLQRVNLMAHVEGIAASEMEGGDADDITGGGGGGGGGSGGAVLRGVRRTNVGVSRALDAHVAENGGNFSLGQRQLICIARALLRRSRLILLDEATSSVDVETDAMIQKHMRSEFAASTVITVAHRINTIIDSDRVLVLERGRVAEFDTPQRLLRDPQSLFYSLVHEYDHSE